MHRYAQARLTQCGNVPQGRAGHPDEGGLAEELYTACGYCSPTHQTFTLWVATISQVVLLERDRVLVETLEQAQVSGVVR